jgi:hypothetical protein
MVNQLAIDGFMVLPWDPAVADWATAAYPEALKITADPAQQARWLRHGGTWFVGVDALPNAPDGSIGGAALGGGWQDVIRRPPHWHKAQLSVIYPGYPRRDADETDVAHRFRLTRDAAHLDGLLAEGPDKRRHLREPHGFILGIGLNAVDSGASPLVVWEGSHHVIRAAFATAFAGVRPQDWGDLDVTDIYQAARAQVFAACPRRVMTPGFGQAVLVHRLAIHGVAPWETRAAASPAGRMVAYFRPLLPDPADWLMAD